MWHHPWKTLCEAQTIFASLQDLLSLMASWCWLGYPHDLGNLHLPYWKWPFIVDFPIESMVIFHSYGDVYERVCEKCCELFQIYYGDEWRWWVFLKDNRNFSEFFLPNMHQEFIGQRW